jgi:hypothetical protein
VRTSAGNTAVLYVTSAILFRLSQRSLDEEERRVAQDEVEALPILKGTNDAGQYLLVPVKNVGLWDATCGESCVLRDIFLKERHG